jgi:ABC-type uncharacterized transport system involved in gliding motility auxiliary subunit
MSDTNTNTNKNPSTNPNQPKKSNFNKKKFKYGSIAVSITIVIVALAVVLNVVLSMLSDKYSLKVDLTKNKLYEISDTTTDYLESLNREVDIVVTMAESSVESDSYLQYAKAIFDKFENISEYVNVKYVDIMKKPEEIAKYQQNYGSNIDEYQIIISSGTRVKVYPLENLLNLEADYTTGQYVVTSLNIEALVTPAIMSVTDSNPKKVAIISLDMAQAVQYSLMQFENLLDMNGYTFTEIDILSDELSSDYDLAVVYAPGSDFTTTSIDKLQKFLENGDQYGKYMLYVASASQSAALPNLDAFLDEWGIKISTDVIMETNNNQAQYVNLAIGIQYPCPLGIIDIEEYSTNLDNQQKPIVLPYSRPIEILWETNSNRSVESIISTSATTAPYPLAESSEENPIDVDSLPKSSQVAMTLSTKTWADSLGTDVRTSKLLVIGGDSFFDPNVISDSAFNNSDFAIKTINSVVGKESIATFAPKSILPPTIDVSVNEFRVIQIIVVFLIPIIVIVLGVVIFVKRKNR